LVLKDGVVFNNDYEGSPKAGGVKIPVRDTEVAVSDYDKANGITAGTGSTSYETMLIDKDKAVNEIIDGYDAAGVPDNLVADRLDSAGYSLAKQIDTDGATTLIAGSTVVSAATLTKDNIYSKLVDLRTAMSKANIPNDGKRYFLATPDTMALILNAPEFVKASDLGDAVVQTGAVGKIAGFLIIEWNDETPNLAGIAGHPRFATRAEEFSVPVHIQDLSQSGKYIGASAVQGRDAYGHKVLRSTAIRALFAPGVTTTSVAVGTSAAGDTKVTATLATANSGGSLAYKKNPSETIAYGTTSTAYAGTSMTTATAKVISSCVAGDIIEVAEFNSDGNCISCAYITLVASNIKA
jgi:hypothetical protein